jgi:general secretion pathway protein G
MAQAIGTGRSAWRDQHGFSLIELLVVVTIVGILASLAEPAYFGSVKRAKEATLRRDLFVIRDLLDQYRVDRGQYPKSLSDLVTTGYLRGIPLDPITKSAGTWQEIAEPSEGGIWDARSGSDLVGSNGVPYNQW